MEHVVHVPDGFQARPPRLLVVGHSHHRREDEDDYPDFTLDTVDRAKEGRMQEFPFFARQPRYLHLSREAYYDTVALMNFVPTALTDRYARPSAAQLQFGRERFARVLATENPTHVAVLSSRLCFGHDLPPTLEKETGAPLRSLTV